MKAKKIHNLSLRKMLWNAILSSTIAFGPTYQALANTPNRIPAAEVASEFERTRIVPNMKSPEGTSVIYQMSGGQIETDKYGRKMVYSWKGDKGGEPTFRRGVVEANGAVTWYGAFNSRLPGQTQYPFYPEAKVKGGNQPIPTNKSLVPVGQPTTVQGSGQSNINSPSRTYLPEFDPANRPSALSRAAGWTREHTRLAREQVGEIARKGIDFENGKKRAGEAGTKLFQGGATMGFSAFAFYIALGVSAGYVLMRDYPNDPVAWDSYLDTLSDPVGWASLIGFMVTAGMFYKRFGLENKKGLRKLPVFAGGLMVGMMASTAIDTFARDPAFIKCMGLQDVKRNLDFHRPLADCDDLYNRFTGDSENSGILTEIMAGFAPMAAGLAAATPVYLSAMYAFGRGAQLIDKTKLAQWFRTVALSKKPVQGVNGILLNVGSVLVLLGSYAAVESVFGIQKSVKEYMLTTRSLGSHEFGLTLSSAEKNLLTIWKEIKANAWADPKNEKFEKTLDRYAKLQGSWRALQLAETQAAYDSWVKKGIAYKTFMEEAKNFYRTALDTIINQPAAFTVPLLRETNPPSPLFGEDFNGKWKYLNTWRKTDYLLASMACGPEAEGQTPGSLFEVTRRFLKDNVTGNSSPKKMFEDDLGEAIVFHPPRVTKALPGTLDTVCELTPGAFSPMDALGSKAIYTVENLPISINKGLFGIDQLRYLGMDAVEYRGLTSYIKDNIRENILVPGQPDSFDQWWEDRVGPQVERIEAEMQKEYFKMLESSFKRSIERDESYWCDLSTVQGTGLESQFQKLPSKGESCTSAKLHRLNRGIFANLRDELRLYAAMVMDLPQQKTDAESQAALAAKVQSLVATFDQMALHISTLELGTRYYLESQGQGQNDLIKLAISQINDLYSSTVGDQSVEGDFKARWASDLVKKMGSVFDDGTKLYAILTAFEKR